MTGWVAVTYLGLWIVVIVLAVLLLGTMREVALIRRPAPPPPRRQRGDPNGPELGSEIPDLNLESTNGFGRVQLHAYGEQNLLVAFLTPTCEGCQLAVDSLNQVANTGHNHLAVVAVLSGGETAARSFVKLFPMEFPVVFDPSYGLSGRFGIHVTPSALLYDDRRLLVRSGAISEPDELEALLEGER